MRPARHTLLVIPLAASVLVGGCSGDGEQPRAATETSTESTAVATWNAQRAEQGSDPAADERALAVLRRIEQAGVTCTDARLEDIGSLVASYTEVGLPVPLGSASCTGPAGENLLVGVFPTEQPPAAADFIARKRQLVCDKGYELGARPDGTNDFEGLPYVDDPAAGWIVEPDSLGVNRQIAEALDLEPRNACTSDPAQ